MACVTHSCPSPFFVTWSRLNLSVADEKNRRVAHVEPEEPIALKTRDGQRGLHGDRAIQVKALPLQAFVGLPDQVREEFLHRPLARARGEIIGHQPHHALGAALGIPGSADAIR
jgi:hypothetical protein